MPMIVNVSFVIQLSKRPKSALLCALSKIFHVKGSNMCLPFETEFANKQKTGSAKLTMINSLFIPFIALNA